MREETRHQRSGDRRRFECATGRTRYKRVKSSRFARSSSTRGPRASPWVLHHRRARVCPRPIAGSGIFPFASGRPFSSAEAGGRRIRRPSTCDDRPSPRARASLSKTVCSYDCDFFTVAPRIRPSVRKPPPRASHRVARGASRFAASLVPRRLLPALRTRASKAASRPAEMGSTMHATQAQLKDAKVDLAYRDFCAHLLIPLNECRKANYFLPWRCEHDRHVYEKCQYKECVARARDEGVRLANPPPPTAPPLRRSENPRPPDRSIIDRPPRAPSTTPPSAPSESLRAEPLTPRRPPRPPAQVHDARRAAEGRPALKTGRAGGSTRRERRRASSSTAGGVPTRRDGRGKKKYMDRTVQSNLSASRRPSRPPLPLSSGRPRPSPRPVSASWSSAREPRVGPRRSVMARARHEDAENEIPSPDRGVREYTTRARRFPRHRSFVFPP